MILPAIIVVTLLFLIGAVSGGGPTGLKTCLSSLLLIEIWVLVVRHYLRARFHLHTFGFYLFFYLWGQITFFVLGVSGAADDHVVAGPGMAWREHYWVQIVYGLLTLGISWAVAAYVMRRPIRQVPDPEFAREEHFVFTLALPFNVLMSLVAILPGLVADIVKTFGFHTLMIPFFVGRRMRMNSPVFWGWCAFLALNFAVSLSQGGRFNAAMPLIVFLIGVALRLPTQGRVLIASASLVASFPFFWIMGLFGTVRAELGRDQEVQLSLDRIAQTVSATVAATGDTELATRSFLSDGWLRLIPWANYVCIAYTPDPIVPRGFNSIDEEIVAAAAIYRFAPTARTRMGELEMGTLGANRYGYAVGEGFSVEWGLVADGWSRGFWWGGMLFFSVGCTMVFLLERLVAKAQWLRGGFKSVLLAVLMGRMMVIDAVPLFELIRSTVLAVVLYSISLIVLQKIYDFTARRR